MRSIEDVADKIGKYFNGHLAALWQYFGCDFTGSEHLKLPEKFSRHLVAFFVGRVSLNTIAFNRCAYRILGKNNFLVTAELDTPESHWYNSSRFSANLSATPLLGIAIAVIYAAG